MGVFAEAKRNKLKLVRHEILRFLGLWLIIRATMINQTHKAHLGISVYLLS